MELPSRSQATPERNSGFRGKVSTLVLLLLGPRGPTVSHYPDEVMAAQPYHDLCASFFPFQDAGGGGEWGRLRSSHCRIAFLSE